MIRFIVYAVPLLILLLALFGFAVELLDAEPRRGSVIRLALFEQPQVPGNLVVGAWLVEVSGLIALFLLAQGRFAAWWLDGLVAGWVAWVFRGPLLVITIVVAARQPQGPWWKLAFGWWVLYSVCGLSLAILARRSRLEPWILPEVTTEVEQEQPENASAETTVDQAASQLEPKEAAVEPESATAQRSTVAPAPASAATPAPESGDLEPAESEATRQPAAPEQAEDAETAGPEPETATAATAGPGEDGPEPDKPEPDEPVPGEPAAARGNGEQP